MAIAIYTFLLTCNISSKFHGAVTKHFPTFYKILKGHGDAKTHDLANIEFLHDFHIHVFHRSNKKDRTFEKIGA